MGVSRRRFVKVDVLGVVEVEVTVNEYRLALDADTSSSNVDRLRLFKESRMLGSMFSLSEPISGDAARRLSEGAELGVIATDSVLIWRLDLSLLTIREPTILSVLQALQGPDLGVTQDAEGLTSWCGDGS